MSPPPLLQESEAIRLIEGFESLPEEERPQARATLQQYQTRQKEQGLPLFPTAEAEERQEQERVRGLFTNGLESVPYQPPGESTDPNAEKALYANMELLRQAYPEVPEQELQDRHPDYRNDYARQTFQIQGSVGEVQLYDLQAKHTKQQIENEKSYREAVRAGYEAAAGNLGALAGLKTFQDSHPELKDETPHFLSAYSQTQKRLRPYSGMITSAMDALERQMDGRAQEGDGSLVANARQAVVDLPPEDRQIVLYALNKESAKRGAVNAAKKGGTDTSSAIRQTLRGLFGVVPNADTSSFLQQAGEGAYRMGKGMLEGAGRMEFTQAMQEVPESGEVYFSGGQIDTPEKARAFIEERALSTVSNRFSSHGDYAEAGQALARWALGEETVAIDATGGELIRQAKDRIQKELQVGLEFDALGNSVDPVPNFIASTVGSSVAVMGGIMATRGLIAPMLFEGYAGLTYDELSLKYPGMDHDAKRDVSTLSAAFQTALDFVGLEALHHLPGLKSLLTQPLSKMLITRAGIRVVAVNGVENTVEGLQDAATPLLLALRGDVPGFDWEEEKRVFWRDRVQVGIAMLPLTLLGIGVSTVQEYRGAKELLFANDRLGAAGIVETDRIAITDAARKGDYARATTRLQQAWANRSPEVAAEYQERLDKQQAQDAHAFAEARRLGMLPQIQRHADGYAVTDSNGKAIVLPTLEQALQSAELHWTETAAAQNNSSRVGGDGFSSTEARGHTGLSSRKLFPEGVELPFWTTYYNEVGRSGENLVPLIENLQRQGIAITKGKAAGFDKIIDKSGKVIGGVIEYGSTTKKWELLEEYAHYRAAFGWEAEAIQKLTKELRKNYRSEDGKWVSRSDPARAAEEIIIKKYLLENSDSLGAAERKVLESQIDHMYKYGMKYGY